MGSPRHQPTDMTRATLLLEEQQREKELAEHKKELAEQRRREEIEKNKKALADLAQADQRRKVRTAEKREAAQRKASQRLRAKYHNSSDSNPSNPGNPPNNNDCKYKVGLASALACAGFSYAGACKAFTAVALLAAMPIWGWALLVSVSFVGIAYCSHKLFSDSKRRRAQEENLYHMPPPSPTNCCF